MEEIAIRPFSGIENNYMNFTVQDDLLAIFFPDGNRFFRFSYTFYLELPEELSPYAGQSPWRIDLGNPVQVGKLVLQPVLVESRENPDAAAMIRATIHNVEERFAYDAELISKLEELRLSSSWAMQARLPNLVRSSWHRLEDTLTISYFSEFDFTTIFELTFDMNSGEQIELPNTIDHHIKLP